MSLINWSYFFGDVLFFICVVEKICIFASRSRRGGTGQRRGGGREQEEADLNVTVS